MRARSVVGSDVAENLLEELRRELRREQDLRRSAESAAERMKKDLTDLMRELRSTRAELLDRTVRTRLLAELARGLRGDLDSQELASRAAEAVGVALSLHACRVLLDRTDEHPAVNGSWARTAAEESPTTVPPVLEALLETAEPATVLILDSGEDEEIAGHFERVERLTGPAAQALREGLGVAALAAVPVMVGHRPSGWVVMKSAMPRSWRSHEVAMCESVARELAASVVQVRAAEQQRRSLQQLRDLDRAKDAFISTVSHELRTPLTSIIGYLEMLTEGSLGHLEPGVSDGIAVIARNVVRLRSLVEDLLTLSAYDAAQLHLSRSEVDLAELVLNSREILRADLNEKDLSLLCDLAPLRVPGDRRQLERVVINLLDNAVKFSRPGGQIAVTLAEDGPDAVLVVADEGIGIPETELPHAFNRFFRSTLAIAGEIQGTGLGLPLVHAMVHAHRGTVHLESAEGRGTTVTVRLPRDQTG